MININEIYPLYITENLAILRAFYEMHFDFTAVFYEADFYLHLTHMESGNQLRFMAPNHPSQPPFLHSKASNVGAIISFDVSDAKLAFQIAKETGLSIVMEYTEEQWGQNHLDPQGLLIDVVEHVQQD